MSQLLDLYQKSQKLRPTQAREIPNREVNAIDQQNEFAVGWKNGQKNGDPTLFTKKSLEYYDQELKDMIIPTSFVRHDQDIPLNQWNPKTKYYVPGRSPGESSIGSGNR